MFVEIVIDAGDEGKKYASQLREKLGNCATYFGGQFYIVLGYKLTREQVNWIIDQIYVVDCLEIIRIMSGEPDAGEL